METLARLTALLPAEAGKQLSAWSRDVCEVRLRVGKPVQLRGRAGEWLSENIMDASTLNRAVISLLDHSLYAREEELRQGYFTMPDGCRVGVCGRLVFDGQNVTGMGGIGSLCVRVSREMKGCADGLMSRIIDETGRVRSALIVSAPGMGKTTLLREIARKLSEGGHNVGLADERHELAACRDGYPTLNVGPRTDVMDGGPKSVAISHMLRATAPDVVIADEIGGEGDAAALAEAARCGVAVIASAHAGSFEQLNRRRALQEALKVFEIGILLGGTPGNVVEIRDMW